MASSGNNAVKTRPDYFWEDLVEGDVIISPGLTITETHLVQWAGLTGDWVSLHLDSEYAKASSFGQRVGHGPLTLSVAMGLLTQTGYFSNVAAWLGLDEVRAMNPVFIGDTVRAQATAIEARPTEKPGRGVWTLLYEVKKQDGSIVMTFRSSFLMLRREESEREGCNG